MSPKPVEQMTPEELAAYLAAADQAAAAPAADVGWGPGVRAPDAASANRAVEVWVGDDRAAGPPAAAPPAQGVQSSAAAQAPAPLPQPTTEIPAPSAAAEPPSSDLDRMNEAYLRQAIARGLPAGAVLQAFLNGGERAFSTGVPVVGAWADEANAAINATLAPVVEPVMHALPEGVQRGLGYDPAYDIAAPGASWGDRYAAAAAWDRQLNEAAREARPGMHAAGLVGGSVAALPWIPSAAGLLPETAGLLPRMAVMGAEGATLGAAQGAGEGEGAQRLDSALMGGAAGGAIGVALPPALYGAGKAARATAGRIADAFRGKQVPIDVPNIDREALVRGMAADADAIDVPALAERLPRDLAETLVAAADRGAAPAPATAVDDAYARIARALARQDQTAQQAAGRVKSLGPWGMLADAGEATRDLARNAANRPGKAGSILAQALNARQQGVRDAGEYVVRPSSQRILDEAARKMGLGDKAFYEELSALDKSMREDSAAFYDAVREFGPVSSPRLEELARRPSVKEAMKRAYRIAREDGKDPEGLGLVNVDNMDDWASAWPDRTQAMAAAEKAAGRGPSRPPAQGRSLVKFIADGGGMRDPGGELSAMDAQLWNRGKAYQRRVIGDADSADGWAMKAWEAGYFPEFAERPTERQLLDAIAAELRGKPRYARAADPKAADRYAAREAAEEMVYRGGPNEAPGPGDYVGRPEPQLEPAYEAQPTLEAWDYVKQGLDDVLEDYRNPITGKLDLDTEGSRIKNTLAEVRRELIELSGGWENGVYKQALDAYAGPASLKTALLAGRNALRVDGEVIGERFADMGPSQQKMYRLGAYQALKDRLGNADVTYDAARTAGLLKPNQLERFKEVFPTRKAFADFVQLLENERTMYETRAAVMGNSSTAKQLAHMADEDDSSFVAGALQAGVDAKTGNVMGLVRALGRVGAPSKMDEPTADALAQILSDTSPQRFPYVVRRLTEAQKRQIVLDVLRQGGARAGQSAAASAGAGREP